MRLLPEWQVFIRRHDGRAQQFTFTRRRQLTILGVVALLSLWAFATSCLLARQPEELVEKERRLDELTASTLAAQHRLTSTHQMVGAVTREIEAVNAKLNVLAQSHGALVKSKTQAKAEPAVPAVADPIADDDAQPGSAEAKAVRDEVRKLEASLSQLRSTYAQVVESTTEIADQRIAQAELSIRRVGLDPQRVLAPSRGKHQGVGGPFIPLGDPKGAEDKGLDALTERMDRWTSVQAGLHSLPLAEPLHSGWELNSPFGARFDPVNRRTGIHEGVDMGAALGTPVYATGVGVVKMAAPFDRYGNTVDIDHGNGVTTRYAHLSKIKVSVGQKVTRSTVIGLVGNTGRSTGSHLHYEVRLAEAPKDPLKFISAGRDAAKAR